MGVGIAREGGRGRKGDPSSNLKKAFSYILDVHA